MIVAILRILFYLALGPLVIMLAGSLMTGVITLATTGSMHDLLFWQSAFALYNLRITYLIGVGPMFLTAIVAIILARAFAGWRYWLWIAFGGASLSMALAWVVFGTSPLMSGVDPLRYFGSVAFAGGSAGFLCATLFDLLIAGWFRRSA